MTWAEFKAAVKDLLTVDANRMGTADFIEQHTRAACIDVMQAVDFYRGGFKTVLFDADFTALGSCSRTDMPDGKITKAHIVRIGAAAPDDYADDVAYSEGDLVLADRTVTDTSYRDTVTEDKVYYARRDIDAGGKWASLGITLPYPVTADDYVTVHQVVQPGNLLTDTWLISGVATSDVNMLSIDDDGSGPALGVYGDGVYTIRSADLGGPYRAIAHVNADLEYVGVDLNTEVGVAQWPYVRAELVGSFHPTTGTAYNGEWFKLVYSDDSPNALATAAFERTTLAGIQEDADWLELNSLDRLEEVTAAGVATVNWHECVNPAWASRYQAINNQIATNDNSGRVFIDPRGTDLLVYPAISQADEFQCVVLEYDSDVPPTDDATETPYDEHLAHVVADWVKGEIARHVNHDLTAYASFLQKPGESSRRGGSYYQKRTALHLRLKERGRINQED